MYRLRGAWSEIWDPTRENRKPDFDTKWIAALSPIKERTIPFACIWVGYVFNQFKKIVPIVRA